MRLGTPKAEQRGLVEGLRFAGRRCGVRRRLSGIQIVVVALAGWLVSGTALGASATAVAAGGYHTCAITSSGGVLCWGDNGSGRLGDGTTMDRLTPVTVSGLASGVTAIVAGGSHTCALTTAGALRCWGENSSGQLGDGTTVDRHMPVTVSGLASGVVSVAAGGAHTCAVTSFGSVQCWGGNSQGQLGDGTTTNRNVPVTVLGLASGMATVAAGETHSCALTVAGGVRCWGANSFGQLGDGTTTSSLTPVTVSGLESGIVAVVAGEYHTCALTTGGAGRCWGYNYFGQLGDGTTTPSPTPVAVSGLGTGIVAVAAGKYHTCAVTAGGAVRCWGSNSYGQVGDGSTTSQPAPVAVSGLGSGVATVSAGGSHTCALTDSGAVRCWGRNDYGQLGDATTTMRLTPVPTVGFQPLASDLDWDGQSDVVWRHTTGGHVWVWPMDGGLPVSQAYLGTVGDTGWQIVGLGDQTGDGRADLLWRHQTFGALYLWTMDGTAVVAQQYLGAVVPEYAIVGTADYTGDGKSDIMWRHQSSGALWLWQMNGATLEAVTWVATISPVYALVASGDVNGDGKADVVWRHQTSGDVWVWPMNGAAPISQAYLGTVHDLGYQIVGLADLDRDGRADILWRHATGGHVWVWQMNGTAVVDSSYVVTVSDTNYRVAGVRDYDGDGRADVLWHHAIWGDVWVWLMDGATITSVEWVAVVPDVGYQVVNPR